MCMNRRKKVDLVHISIRFLRCPQKGQVQIYQENVFVKTYANAYGEMWALPRRYIILYVCPKPKRVEKGRIELKRVESTSGEKCHLTVTKYTPILYDNLYSTQNKGTFCIYYTRSLARPS